MVTTLDLPSPPTTTIIDYPYREFVVVVAQDHCLRDAHRRICSRRLAQRDQAPRRTITTTPRSSSERIHQLRPAVRLFCSG